MASELTIVNSALIELGEEKITSLEQEAERARVMREEYPKVRDELLDEHPWNFAIRRAGLARLAEAPAFGYAYAFVLPADCLSVLEIDPKRTIYEIEAGTLLCDAAAVSVKYLRRVTDANAMPPTFRAALVARLATRTCKKITGSSSEKERLEVLARDRVRTAKGRDAQSGGTPTPPRADAFIRARR